MDIAISKVFTIVCKLMFVESINVFPKLRKQFVHILLGRLYVIKDVGEPTLRILARHLTGTKDGMSPTKDGPDYHGVQLFRNPLPLLS